MLDLVLDFSSSPVGGGLRRVDAYAEYFAESKLRTHFFLHADARNCDKVKQLVPTTLVQKGMAAKVLLKKDYLKPLAGQAKWLYSYGIPVKRGYAQHNWLHVSNVLPFYLYQSTVGAGLFLKTWVLRQQYKANVGNADLVSAESEFSLEHYRRVTGWSGDCFLLRNGVLTANPEGETKEPFAIAVGTLSYKRIDLSYLVFRQLKAELGLDKLLIVGDTRNLPPAIRNAPDVEAHDFLPETEMQTRLKQASYFLSTSEVENSSCAVLEGLQLTQRAILSNIPSHMEMLTKNSARMLRVRNLEYAIVNQGDINPASMTSWPQEIEKMLLQMQLDTTKA